MDAAIVIFLALILAAMYHPKKSADGVQEVKAVKIVENPYLNPEMKHDEHAFMVIANELGFR